MLRGKCTLSQKYFVNGDKFKEEFIAVVLGREGSHIPDVLKPF